MSKQSFRPGAWDPIKHNEFIATMKQMARFSTACNSAVKSIQLLAVAMHNAAEAAKKIRWANE